MAIRGNLPLVVFVLSLLMLTFTTLSLASHREEDPELRDCKHKCHQKERYDEQLQQECSQQCEDYYREKQKREEGEEEEHGRGGIRDQQDPQQQQHYRQCQRICWQQPLGKEQQRICRQFCEEHFGRGEGGGEGNLEFRPRPSSRPKKWKKLDKPEGEGSEEEQQQQNNPYVYQQQHFISKVQTEAGSVRVLDRFTERSELLRGVEKYRVAFLEVQPKAFVLPAHWDGDGLFVVASGQGTISLVNQDKRESFNIERGDILRIPAGTTVYLINKDNNEKLFIVKLFKSVSAPGSLESFSGPAGVNPESYFWAFSTEVLEAALNTDKDILERLLGQQKQGAIVRANKEQIKALSKDSQNGIWPFGRGSSSRGPINILKQDPKHVNEFGQLHEVSPNKYDQLRDINVGVSYANITVGGMIGPYFNSKATKFTIAIGGNGYLEMACPHLSSSSPRGQQEGRGSQHHESGARYQRVSARLRQGTLVVIPAGHPATAVASDDQNLELLCFEINGLDNERIALAGKTNVVNQMPREALELSFNYPGKEAEKIFKNQDQEFFFAGPHLRQERSGRAYA